MRKQKELEARELDLVERELHLMIPPVPKKRRGKVSPKVFKVSRVYYTSKFTFQYTIHVMEAKKNFERIREEVKHV